MIDRRIQRLAREMAAGYTSELARARAIERRLRSDYGYTLELPSREVADPLAYFLFTRKKGHCEYFASSMTVMLRSLGIPARLATGFQSGIYNPLTDFWVVRASDAHTWVEAWIPGYGWTTFDPTPPDPNPQALSLVTKLGLYLDAAETSGSSGWSATTPGSRARWWIASSRGRAAQECTGSTCPAGSGAIGMGRPAAGCGNRACAYCWSSRWECGRGFWVRRWCGWCECGSGSSGCGAVRRAWPTQPCSMNGCCTF